MKGDGRRELESGIHRQTDLQDRAWCAAVSHDHYWSPRNTEENVLKEEVGVMNGIRRESNDNEKAAGVIVKRKIKL